MDISLKGKGGLESPKKLTDNRFEMTPGASVSLPDFDLEPYLGTVEDQGTSLSCVAQEVGGYAEGLINLQNINSPKIKLSKRDIYSKVAMPQGGAYTVDAITKWQNTGIELELDMPSYQTNGLPDALGNPPSEAFMKSRLDDTPAKQQTGMNYLAGDYHTWKNTDPQIYIQAIKLGSGVLAIVYGNNESWQNADILVPANQLVCTWSHQILFVNSAIIMRNGVPNLKFRNSWGKEWGDNGYGYLPLSYITSGLVVSPITCLEYSIGYYFKLLSIIKNLQEKIANFIKGKN